MKCHRSSGVLRLISAIVLCFFTWSFGGLFDIAYAVNNSQKSKVNSQQSKTGDDQQPKYQRPEEKFQKTVEAIEKILNDTSTDTDTKKNKLRGKRSEIEFYDTEIRKQFTATENKLKNEGLPPEILERHYSFVNHYETNLNELKNNLDKIEKAKDKKEADEAIENTKKFLEKVKPLRKHVPLDPNKLPHRTAEPVFIEPRTTPEEFQKDREALAVNSKVFKDQKNASRITHHASPILVASNGSLDGLLSFPSPITHNPSPILVASNGSLDGLLSSSKEQKFNSPLTSDYDTMALLDSGPMQVASADPPTDVDLAENGIEITFSPLIRAKAEELGKNPVKIYNWVRNNIEFVPTYGSIQGADMCLQTRQCNAFDTASLLISLLRISGVSARYALITAEIPMSKIMNWVGNFTDPMTALNLIASGGIPVKGMIVGNELKYARIEEVIVEAWIDYIPSRGEIHKQGDTWIPLDASFKQYTYKEPMDFSQVVGFNTQSFVDEILAGSNIDPNTSSITNMPQDIILQRSQEYIQSIHQYYETNLQNKPIEDIAGSKKIIPKEFSFLLGTLPYRPIVVGSKYSQLPDSLRWRMNFKVASSIYSDVPDFSYTASTASLAGKSITLGYKPASSSDEALLQRYGFIEKVPPYLLSLIPELVVGGEVKASGIAVSAGKDIDFTMTFIPPKGPQDIIINKETVGALLGIGLDLGYLSKIVLDKKIDDWRQLHEYPASSPYRKTEEALSLLSAVYFAEVDAVNIIGARFARVVDVRLPSAGILGADLNVKYLFGAPLSLAFSGLFVDVDRDIHATLAKDGDVNKVLTFNIFSGNNGSSMEHALWEHLYRVPGISTIKVFKTANEQGLTNYKIDASNISSILPSLQVSSDVRGDIINAVNAGKSVYIPKSNIQYFDWSGTGYVVLDEKTGAAGYIVNGLLGGADARDERWWDCIESMMQFADLIPYKSTLLGAAIDHVSFALALSDTGRTTGTNLATKGQSALCSYISLIVTTASLHPRLGKSIGFVIAVTVVEVILWASAYRLNEGKWPILQGNPLQDCFDIYCELYDFVPGCK